MRVTMTLEDSSGGSAPAPSLAVGGSTPSADLQTLSAGSPTDAVGAIANPGAASADAHGPAQDGGGCDPDLVATVEAARAAATAIIPVASDSATAVDGGAAPV